MADDVMSCEGCQSLKILLNKKDEEIKRLNLEIQNLTISLQQFQNQTECDSNCCSSYDTSDADACTEKSKVDTNNSTDIGSDTSKEWHFQKNEDSQIINEEKEDNFSPCKKADIETNDLTCGNISENLNHTSDYIYDEQAKMYYSVSTGYYYDVNTEQFYVPQTDSYYKYDYSKHKYELVKNTKETSDSNLIHTCESVVDKVDNLKINDEEISSSNKSEEVNDVNSTAGRTCFTININVTSSVCGQNSDSVEDQKERPEDETVKNSAADWQPPEGSNTTVKDLVTEVAEQSIGMSDFIYDEKSSMYYCKSNGYYYDPIKKLLYDPRSRIYYLYIQETLSYEFYCKADSNSNAPNNTSSIDCTNSEKKYDKDKARKKFWKKKQKESLGKTKIISSEKKEDIFEEDVEIINEGFSSPEAGEIFSSDSDSESIKEFAKEDSSSCPPCIRAIVECSTKLKVGSLILITCTGAIVGRDHFNAIHIPDISVSKVHAGVTFDDESWKYSVEDLGSQNGTFVNEIRLSEPKQRSGPQVLSHGDKVAFGSCKFLIHIHDGYETCDKCEPGQVMADLSSKEVKSTPVLKTKQEKEKERRQEMRRLKKRYGLEGMEYSEGKSCISATDSKYEDKAEIRRQLVGSENPYEKTEVASMDVIMPESNKGYQMLKKLGWKEGDSLGLTNSGISQPIPIRPWMDKAGLGCTDMETSGPAPPEDKRKRKWVKAQERYFRLSA